MHPICANRSKSQKPVDVHKGTFLGWEIVSETGFLSDLICYLPSPCGAEGIIKVKLLSQRQDVGNRSTMQYVYMIETILVPSTERPPGPSLIQEIFQGLRVHARDRS